MGEGPQAIPKLARRADKLAPRLRQRQTDVERTLWHAIRDRRLNGDKFRRQAPLGPYLVDFFCLEAGLIVELDGQHADESPSRQSWLEQNGYRVLRFWNNDVTDNLIGALEMIAIRLVKGDRTLTPTLFREKREKAGAPP